MTDDGADASIRLIGYWHAALPDGHPGASQEQGRRGEHLRQTGRLWPDPAAFVDPHWDGDERRAVVHHLETGTLVNQYRGLSRCRCCDRCNGSAELTDGTYCWPEGLAHYLQAHAVRLPHEFVDHVAAGSVPGGALPSPRFDELGQRDRDWPGADLRHRLWAPPHPDDGYDRYVDADPTWWLHQVHRVHPSG